MTSVARTVSASALAAALLGCSGGGSSDPAAPGGGAGGPSGTSQPRGTPISAEGTITGFGSVFVNGTRYAVGDQTLVVVEGQNGVPGGQSLLRIGQKVRIEARQLDDGSAEADTIAYDEDLRGPAVDIMPRADNPAIGTFRVVGQEVVVDALTVFGDDFDDLNADGVIDIRDLDGTAVPGTGVILVEVSGSITETGVVASRIDPLGGDEIGRPDTDDDEIEVKGFVDDVTGDGDAIIINGARFEITASTEFDDGLVADASLVGVFVEVKADIESGGRFIAVEIERGDRDADDDDDREGAEVDIEGILSAVDTVSVPNTITINGRTIAVDDASALAGLVGQRVEIEGVIGTGDVLELDEVEIERAMTVDVRDEVASVDVDAGTITTRLGITIAPDGESRILDLANPQGGPSVTPAEFLSRLAALDDIRAMGYPDGEGSVVWTMVRREPRDVTGCSLKAPVEEPITPGVSFTLRGVTIETSGLTTDDGFENDDDSAIGSAAFYDALDAGDVVRADSLGSDSACTPGAIVLVDGGTVALDSEDDIEGNDDDGARDDDRPEDGDDDDGDEAGDITGAVRGIDVEANTLTVGARIVPVLGTTLVDDDIIEAARGAEVEDDLPFGDIGLALDVLFANGMVLDIDLDDEGNAVSIELED